MISAEVGFIPKVKGRSMATVFTGEIPGRTPTSVPAIAPMKQ